MRSDSCWLIHIEYRMEIIEKIRGPKAVELAIESCLHSKYAKFILNKLLI